MIATEMLCQAIGIYDLNPPSFIKDAITPLVLVKFDN